MSCTLLTLPFNAILNFQGKKEVTWRAKFGWQEGCVETFNFFLVTNSCTKNSKQAHCQGGKTYLMLSDCLAYCSAVSEMKFPTCQQLHGQLFCYCEDKFLHFTDIFICSICWWISWAFNNFNRGQTTCKNQKTTQNLVFFSLSVSQQLLSTLWKLLLYFFFFKAKCDVGTMFFHACHFLGMIKLQMEQQTPVFNKTSLNNHTCYSHISNRKGFSRLYFSYT